MKHLYSEDRKNQIFANLSKLKLLNQTEYRNDELLETLREFANALLETVHEKEHASHLSIRTLGQYLLNQSDNVGLEDSSNVAYAANQIDRLSYRIHCLESGKFGETRANRALFGIDAPNRILRNVEVDIDGEPYEMDFIVINQAGIFAIESKHYNRNMVIDHSGALVGEGTQENASSLKKIGMQMANQRAAVRRILTDAFPDHERFMVIAENVKSVLLSTSNYSITDLREKEKTLTCDTVADYLNHASGMELTREEINLIAETLENAVHEKTYPIGWDYKRVAEAFARAVAKIEYASENKAEYSEGNSTVTDFLEKEACPECDFFKKEENSGKRTGWGFLGGMMAITLVGIGMHIFKK